LESSLEPDEQTTIHLFSSVEELDHNTWNRIAGGKIFLSTDYLRVAEISSLPGMQFRYAIMNRNDLPVAIMYFQLVNLSDEGLGGILDLEEYGGMAASVSTRINDLLFNPGNGSHSFLLSLGNLLVSGDHGIAAVSDSDFNLALSSVTSVKKEIAGQLGKSSRIVALMVKDFYETEHAIAHPILKRDYFLLNTDPEMIFDPDPEWKNFDDYLAALSSKYRIRANNARSKMEEVVIRNLTLNEIVEQIDEIFRLNSLVMRKAPVKLAKPSPDYFINLKKVFGENYQIRTFYLGEKMIAFTSSLFTPDHYEAHYIGLDYHYNRSHQLYQNILYDYVEAVISARSKRLYFGRTALEIKSTTGAKPYFLACYFRFANRIIHTLARPLVSSAGPRNWIPRDPFKTE
jgi:predicted N-acyltransferase